MPHRGYAASGEELGELEHEILDTDSFKKIIDKLADLEKLLGINDLSKFIPAA